MEMPPPSEDLSILHADQPAELLAAARLSFGTVPRDSLLLVGHSGTGSHPVMTRSPLLELRGRNGREHLEHHLTLMQERGCTGAVGMVVLRDGTEEVQEQELAEGVGRCASVVLHTASQMLPDPFDLHPLWVLAAGTARQVVLDCEEGGDDVAIGISPPAPLVPFDRTVTALDAVLAGRSLGTTLPGRETLAAVGQGLQLRPSYSDVRAAGHLLREARRSCARLGVREAASIHSDPAFMTDCERVGAMLSALALDSIHWEVLGLCVEHGTGRPIDRDTLLQELTSDPTRRPNEDVCAGGAWYSALELLREAAQGARHGGDPDSAARAADAWRGLTTVLALLAWWNHRFATAGEFVDDLVASDPDGTLAPLLSALIDAPIAPAWWPPT